jgi:(S)-2-hydroxy-acid oxidase
MPIGVAATAFQKLAHPDGERANARAAANADAIFVLSTIATTSIEQIAKATPNSQKWFQLYIYKDREITKQLIRRVEACNFKAIVLTVDTPVSGIRRADVRNKFNLPKHLS